MLKRVADLKGQVEAERAVRNEMENQLLDKDGQIAGLKNQVCVCFLNNKLCYFQLGVLNLKFYLVVETQLDYI